MSNQPLIMRGKVHIEPGYEKLLSFADPKRPFESLSEYFGYPLGRDQRRRSKVACKELLDADGNPELVYFKLYGYRRLRRALSRIFKPTRSKSEITNLKLFRQWGIPACEPILQGEYRNVFGIARNCMLITRAVTGTEQLDDFITTLETGDDDQTMKTSIRRQIIESVAQNLRTIHEHQFYHDDLKWRNILVRSTGERGEGVEVFWIDCPNGYFDRTGGWRGQHGKIKDLATYDYDACKHGTKDERLYFLSVYSGLEVGSPEFEQLAQQVFEYRKLKLDDDRPR